ncbi:MAG: ABC transporter substrate-binding protein [Deltaproteobacteria bacterium]|nr:ABC transporter substrate-binding protein [Deltaproteobacteria bacterium]
MNIRLGVSVCALFLSVTLARTAETAEAGVPTDQIRVTVDRVLAILKDPNLKSDGAQSKRRAELSKAIIPRFDFEEMAKRALGAEWRRRTPTEQKEFINLFTDLLKDSYVTTIESYRGDRVVYRREAQDGRFAEVGTGVLTEQDQEFVINYRMHLVASEWKVYDVVLENISIVNNFRSQFRRLLGRSSFADLLRTIREKTH